MKTQQRKVVLCSCPYSLNTVERTAMSWQKYREEFSLKKLSIFLGNMCPMIVHDQYWASTAFVLTFDLHKHLFKELLEFDSICRCALHENSTTV